jgi:4a-hydroxytetrahydrobiopterin dehydratase
MTALANRHCQPSVARLADAEAGRLLAELPGWAIEHGLLAKSFGFGNYHETLAFVNAVAWIAHREDHHPDLAVSYNRCHVAWNTHSVGGLSENDFICAARVEALLTA